jgi:hypothetical protein
MTSTCFFLRNSIQETSKKIYLRNKMSSNGKKYVQVNNTAWMSEFPELDD